MVDRWDFLLISHIDTHSKDISKVQGPQIKLWDPAFCELEFLSDQYRIGNCSVPGASTGTTRHGARARPAADAVRCESACIDF